MKNKFIKNLFKKTLIMLLVLVSLLNNSVTVFAISPEQKKIFDGGIKYFDYEKNECEVLGSAAGTGPCLEALLPNITDGNALAQAIDKYIEQTVPSSPLKGLGSEFVKSGIQYGINPMYIVAISQKESSMGTAGIAIRGGHNSFGRKAGGGQPSVNGFYAWPSWKDSISTDYEDNQFAFLKRVYLDKGFDTIAKIREKYCPNSDGCAENYTKVIGSAMTKIVQLAGSALGCNGGTTPPTTQQQSTTQNTTQNGGGQVSATYVGDANAFPDSGGPIKPTSIILHYTAIPDNVSAVNLVSSMRTNNIDSKYPRGRVVQLYVRRDGSAWQLTKTLESRPIQTLTGGPADPWNDSSIAIEIEGLTEEELLSNNAQFFGVVNLVNQLMAKYGISKDADLSNRKGVVGHYEINPKERTDPGQTFMAKVRSAIQNGVTSGPEPGKVVNECGDDSFGNVSLPGYPQVISPQENCTKLAGYNDKLKESTKNLCNAVQQSFAGMPPFKNVGNCWRSSGSTKTSDHPKGLACDFTISPNSDPVGYKIVEWAIKYKDPLKVKLIIFDDRSWSSTSDFKERPYKHPSCSSVQNCSDNYRHLNHVHISVKE